jgi:hypothetical protein
MDSKLSQKTISPGEDTNQLKTIEATIDTKVTEDARADYNTIDNNAVDIKINMKSRESKKSKNDKMET